MQVSQLARTSPGKVFERAAAYTKNLWRHHQLPKSMSKSMFVKQHAQDHKEKVQFAIRRSSYQLQLYRRKEEEDAMRRTSYSQKLAESAEKVTKNGRDIAAKHTKDAKNYEKHLKATYSKYLEGQKRQRQQEKETAYKLRKELQEFYEKEAERKRKAEGRQVSVGTCYQDAVEKINNIHRLNEERSFKAQQDLHQQLNKNSHFHEILTQRRRSLSSMNQQKSRIYDQNMSILEKREHSFIQKYGQNQEGSLSAFKHIEEEEAKTKKRLGEFFKTRTQKWSQQKKRVDEAKAEIPKKCTSILERTNNSFFKQTLSSFKTTAREWQKRVSDNKSAIRSEDERKKDSIMGTHYDLRLKNTSSLKVTERMNSMRLHAKKLASEYL